MVYPESYRNYRIIAHKDVYKGIETERVGLYEVHYDHGKVVGWSENPSATGNDIDDLIGGLELMLADAKKCKKEGELYVEENDRLVKV
ncbi:MAG: hypothetical protein CR971_00620 [candidate division SR1 bacterium]|nr:MAG: hypothetical protein CR971_00620 [candidate division SR1 bacterium]